MELIRIIPKRAVTALKKKKCYTVHDLAQRFPRLYRDYREPIEIFSCFPDTYAAVEGTLIACNKRSGQKRDYLSLWVESKNGERFNVNLFMNFYMLDAYKKWERRKVIFCGKVSYSDKFGYSMTNPEWFGPIEVFKGGIWTIYPACKGISEEKLREYTDFAVEMEREYLPEPMRREYGLPELASAMKCIHHPDAPGLAELCKRRFVFEDLLYFSSNFLQDSTNEQGYRYEKHSLTDSFFQSLPFSLTEDQKSCVNRIETICSSGRRFDGLVQGDVGCGKTMIAVAFMFLGYENGYQTVLMVPRDALAKQHYEEISEYGKKYGINSCFLHAGLKAAERKKILKGIKDGTISFIIGTQSCISEKVEYKNLGGIVLDEEHLLGVLQKDALGEKTSGVHVLSMSATPIPRTLATALYGDAKEVLNIRTKPSGRIPVQTAVQHYHENTFRFMLRELEKGHQAYVVCPAIDSNKEYNIVAIEDIEKMYRDRFEYLGYKVGVVHGNLKKKETDEILNGFVKNEIQILISTRVIEVGINVPNATVMVIEQSDRFGLSSLHQLRGRVGRSSFPSYCILLTETEDNKKLKIMTQTTDGFKIAEADMKIRGAGDLLGIQQSGSNRYVEEMLSDQELFRQASAAARKYRGRYDELIHIYQEHEALEENC